MQSQPIDRQDLGPFLGRRHEIETVRDALLSGARLLTIAGPSGMGKSRLASEVVSELQQDDHFDKRIVVCRLEGCATSRDFREAIARSLGIPFFQDLLLSSAIGEGRLLLVLDDLDPRLLKVAAGILDRLFDDCEGLQALVTSLAPLGVEGEVQFELGPLEVGDAVDLYLEHAHRFAAGRSVNQDDGQAIEELVRQLDCMPLAIELAAARVRVLPPRALLARISERFEILQTGGAGRHGSLYRAVERTWDLLSADEKLFATRASVFQGGFSLEAAEAVLGSQDGADSTFGLIAQLRSKSLIQVDRSVPPRYLPYESVRAFAAVRLQQMEHGVETICRHSEYFLREGELRVSRLSGPDAAVAIEWIAAEHENLIVAHRRNIERRPSLAARLGLIVGAVVGVRSLSISEISFADSVLAAARKTEEPTLLIQALRLRSRIYVAHGRFEEGQADTEEGLEIARRHGERLLEGFLLCERMGGQPDLDDQVPTHWELERVLGAAKELGSTELEALSMAVLGGREADRGHLARARQLLEESLSIALRSGHIQVKARALVGLGEVYSGLSMFREARQSLQEATSILQALGDLNSLAEAMVRLGRMELGAGRLEEASTQTSQAIALMEASHGRASEAEAVGILGQIALAQGKHELAEQRLAAAAAGLHERGYRRGHTEMLAFLAAAAALQGRHLEASRSLNDAKAWIEESKDSAWLAWIELIEATLDVVRSQQLLLRSGKEEAEALIERARERVAAVREEPPQGAGSNLHLATQLLEHALARLEREDLPHGLIIGPGASWFSYEGSAKVGLHRRRSLRRLLLGLVKQRQEQPGVGLGSLELFRLGWIGEDIGVESATARVYTGIWTLRSLGLGEVLVNKGDGYMLRSDVELELVE